MRARWAVQVLGITCLLGVACAPLPTRPGSGKSAAGVLDGAARVPAGTPAALVVAHLGDTVRALRELHSVADTAHEGSRLPAMDAEMNRLFGLSLMDVAALATHGIDVAGPASLALDQQASLLAVHVTDAGRVEALIAALAQKYPGAPSVTHRGRRVTRFGAPGLRVEAVLLDGWLHVRAAAADQGASGPSPGGAVRASPASPADVAWVDRILDRQGGLAATPDFTWALAQGGGRDGAVVVVRFGALLGAFARAPSADPTCLAAEAGVAGAIGRLGFAATVAEGGVDAQGTVELARELRELVLAHAGAPIDEAFADARVTAAAVVALAVDPAWLGEVGRRHQPACGVGSSLAWFALSSLVDPLEGLYGTRLFDAVSLALLSLRMPGSIPEPTLIGRFGVIAPDDVNRLLDTWVPSFLRATHEVPGGKVIRVDLSMLGAPGPLELAQTPRQLTVAVGDGLIEPLLVASKPMAERELASLQLRPDRVPDLAGPLIWLSEHDVLSRGSAEAHARLFGRFSWIGVRAVAVETGLGVTLGYKLR